MASLPPLITAELLGTLPLNMKRSELLMCYLSSGECGLNSTQGHCFGPADLTLQTGPLLV